MAFNPHLAESLLQHLILPLKILQFFLADFQSGPNALEGKSGSEQLQDAWGTAGAKNVCAVLPRDGAKEEHKNGKGGLQHFLTPLSFHPVTINALPNLLRATRDPNPKAPKWVSKPLAAPEPCSGGLQESGRRG